MAYNPPIGSIYHLYIAFWVVICYLPPFKQPLNQYQRVIGDVEEVASEDETSDSDLEEIRRDSTGSLGWGHSGIRRDKFLRDGFDLGLKRYFFVIFCGFYHGPY